MRMEGAALAAGRGAAFERDGFAVVPRAVCEESVAALARALDAVADSASEVRRRGGVYAIRNLLEVSAGVRAFAESKEALSLAASVLGPACFAVRGTLFDKTPDARWKVAWHQDLSIAVEERRDVEGFGPWSLKAGVWHVQPPARVLETMLALRVHLDACDESNGALRVLPGSHACGRLSREGIERCLRAAEPVSCAVPRGGALLMRPLLLHSSPTPRVAGRRRVIHLEYAASALPCGLKWRL